MRGKLSSWRKTTRSHGEHIKIRQQQDQGQTPYNVSGVVSQQHYQLHHSPALPLSQMHFSKLLPRRTRVVVIPPLADSYPSFTSLGNISTFIHIRRVWVIARPFQKCPMDCRISPQDQLRMGNECCPHQWQQHSTTDLGRDNTRDIGLTSSQNICAICIHTGLVRKVSQHSDILLWHLKSLCVISRTLGYHTTELWKAWPVWFHLCSLPLI